MPRVELEAAAPANGDYGCECSMLRESHADAEIIADSGITRSSLMPCVKKILASAKIFQSAKDDFAFTCESGPFPSNTPDVVYRFFVYSPLQMQVRVHSLYTASDAEFGAVLAEGDDCFTAIELANGCGDDFTFNATLMPGRAYWLWIEGTDTSLVDLIGSGEQ